MLPEGGVHRSTSVSLLLPCPLTHHLNPRISSGLWIPNPSIYLSWNLHIIPALAVTENQCSPMYLFRGLASNLLSQWLLKAIEAYWIGLAPHYCNFKKSLQSGVCREKAGSSSNSNSSTALLMDRLAPRKAAREHPQLSEEFPRLMRLIFWYDLPVIFLLLWTTSRVLLFSHPKKYTHAWQGWGQKAWNPLLTKWGRRVRIEAGKQP